MTLAIKLGGLTGSTSPFHLIPKHQDLRRNPLDEVPQALVVSVFGKDLPQNFLVKVVQPLQPVTQLCKYSLLEGDENLR